MIQTSMFVALLRGINVGGKNILPMKDLSAMFSSLGCQDVKTYIQSGNVLFRANDTLAAKVPTEVPAMVEKRFGFRPPVIVRSAESLAKVATQNPFLMRGEETSALHVMFLSATPDAARVATLETSRFTPDEFAVSDQEIFLFYPNGLGKSKMGNDYFEKRLSVLSTIRNWNTTLKLIALQAEPGTHA
jgi:uncharacterized protein (DUF1697 family)